MKAAIALLPPVFMLLACSQPRTDSEEVKRLRDSVQVMRSSIANSYKPGLGEFMSGIQVHHAKLWFAGINSNWELADFEISEIKEALGDIQKFDTDRPEVKSIPMLLPALQGVQTAVQQRNVEQFKSSFANLTNTCNGCHRVTQHGFNIIKTPDSPPYSNQVFEK